MAQFLFEADLHGLLKLDTLIPNARPARWQRKAKESGPGPSPVSVSPMKPANRSHSSSKTPSKTPGKSGSKIQSTPTKAGGDHYIPNRSTLQMEMANFLLTKENDPAEDSPTKKVSMLLSYNYFNNRYAFLPLYRALLPGLGRTYRLVPSIWRQGTAHIGGFFPPLWFHAYLPLRLLRSPNQSSLLVVLTIPVVFAIVVVSALHPHRPGNTPSR
ncbi:cell division cycle protein 20 homolog [Ammospiza maritima maritima]